jgi:2-dehydropantoate 2-reductase
MKVAVIGAGGVGGYFGSKLQMAGHQLQYVARGPHLVALLKSGLTVVTSTTTHHLTHVEATNDIGTLDAPDLVIVAVKSWDTEQVARQLAGVIAPHTVVLSLQNGVVARSVLGRHLPDEQLIGGSAYVSAFITEPGTITHHGELQRIVIGEFDGADTRRLRDIHTSLSESGIDSHTSATITTVLWEKFTFLVGLSATTAVTRAPIGVVRDDPRTRALLLELMTEVTAVGRRLGVDLSPSLPTERLTFCDTLPPDMTSSLANDLAHGRRLELDWLSGYVARVSEELGVSSPANRVITAALSPYLNGA